MAQPKALLDTDTLSAVMKGNPLALARAREYEVQAFDRLCESCTIVPLTDEVAVRAAEVYATLRQRGEPIGDADILIGASALVHDLAVVTNN